MCFSRRPWALNGEAVVLEFVASVDLQPRSVIFIDKWFTSVKLARFLAQEYKIMSCGPIMRTKTSFPCPKFKNNKSGYHPTVLLPGTALRGDTRTLVTDGGTVMAHGWMDSTFVCWIQAGFSAQVRSVPRNVYRTDNKKVPKKDACK